VLIFSTFCTFGAGCFSSCVYAGTTTEEGGNIKGAPILIKTALSVILCCITNLVAWMASNKINAVNAEDLAYMIDRECAENGSYLEMTLNKFNDFTESSGGQISTIIWMSTLQIVLYLFNIGFVYLGPKLIGNNAEEVHPVEERLL
jgi:hypothetical protein